MFEINMINTRNNDQFIKLFNMNMCERHMFSLTVLDGQEAATHEDRLVSVLNNIGFGRIIVDSKKVDPKNVNKFAYITTTGLKVCRDIVSGTVTTIIPSRPEQLLRDFPEFFSIDREKKQILLDRAARNQQYNPKY